ncbi:uncharacterized protein H6S33_009415 [Morchella sextelata]|uniref:uncharacterized protein n=1 Tax=Morchella sextelata TaxID=1174677 RepID=UPI001D046D50|nr:uncharacterized protein H6S33_009415 [Morchella sextelata]KAH0613035.1 hypothetical protein H6S33_009415 [Morchella sextelata]
MPTWLEYATIDYATVEYAAIGTPLYIAAGFHVAGRRPAGASRRQLLAGWAFGNISINSFNVATRVADMWWPDVDSPVRNSGVNIAIRRIADIRWPG